MESEFSALIAHNFVFRPYLYPFYRLCYSLASCIYYSGLSAVSAHDGKVIWVNGILMQYLCVLNVGVLFSLALRRFDKRKAEKLHSL